MDLQNITKARLVMNYDGQIQYFRQGNGSKPVWYQPMSRCSVFNACSKFQSCNDMNSNETMCRCLPGFELHHEECVKKSSWGGKNDTFLSLTMMKAGNPDNQNTGVSDERCKQECLEDYKCQAYSFEVNQYQGRERQLDMLYLVRRS